MFEEEVFCDLKIKTKDGVVLNVHKAILTTRSTVFFKILMTDKKEATTNNVEIKDFDSKTTRELLRFIYCEEVQGLKTIAKDLINAAEKYKVDGLKEFCIEGLSKNVSEENVIDFLIIADQISETSQLVSACSPIVAR
jgi:speckle-type POZ protein